VPAAIAASVSLIASRLVVPVRPQTNARPKRKMAELKEPSRKYLIAPSVEYASDLWKAARR
jgi:hypothetical protein